MKYLVVPLIAVACAVACLFVAELVVWLTVPIPAGFSPADTEQGIRYGAISACAGFVAGLLGSLLFIASRDRLV